jgi:hypothetical protein
LLLFPENRFIFPQNIPTKGVICGFLRQKAFVLECSLMMIVQD